jgi:hypothetical protein
MHLKSISHGNSRKQGCNKPAVEKFQTTAGSKDHACRKNKLLETKKLIDEVGGSTDRCASSF